MQFPNPPCSAIRVSPLLGPGAQKGSDPFSVSFCRLALQLFEISVEILVRPYRQKLEALLIQHTV